MKIGIIIQARLNSTRFPNKVLAKLSDTTVIEEIIDRANKVKSSNIVVVATSDGENDDQLARFLATKSGVEVFRGSEENVLSRYTTIAENLKLDHVIRLTGDNPCIDSKVIEDAIENHISCGADYSCTVGYPLGMNIEVIESTALFSAAKDGQTRADQEHVTFFIRNNPERFKLNFIDAQLPKGIEQLRLTFDTPQDYLLLQILFDYLKAKSKYFAIDDIITLWRSKPFVFSINDSIHQKKVFESRRAELAAAAQLLEKQEMLHAAEIVKKGLDE